MENIKAVLLDVDNTLLDFNLCAKEATEKTYEKWGMAFHEEMFPAFLEVNQFLWEEIEKTHITKEELYQIRWKMIFEKLGIDGPDSAEFDSAFRKYLGESAIPIEGAYALLSYLSKKYILCISSNASYKRQVNRLTNANMIGYIKHLFSSEKIGHLKPAKAFFDACLIAIGDVQPHEVVVIGDSLSADIAGGIGAGMRTIWYNHDKLAISDEIKADYVVNSLSDIHNIL